MEHKWYKQSSCLQQQIFNTIVPQNSLAIWYIGQMGVVVKNSYLTICIDPVLNDLCTTTGQTRRNYAPAFSPESLANVDYVFCTHNHADHLNMQTLLPMYMANNKLQFVVPAPVAYVLLDNGIPKQNIVPAIDGVEFSLAGAQKDETPMCEQLKVTPIRAAHESYLTDEFGHCKNLGYCFNLSEINLYHSGDTFLTSELITEVSKVGKIDITLLPINGVDIQRSARNILGNMNAHDAALCSHLLNADVTIPLHYDMIQNNEENPLIFANYMQQLYPSKKYHIMQLGERFVYMKE